MYLHSLKLQIVINYLVQTIMGSVVPYVTCKMYLQYGASIPQIK